MITYSVLTKKGDHEPNEDSVGTTEVDGRYCFVVADGLGGHGKGEVASQLVTQNAMELFFKEYPKERFVEQVFETGQQKLLESQQQGLSGSGMKTTMVLLTIGENQMEYGHIGDSRLYYFRKNKLIIRTMDHSVPQMLVAVGKIKEKEIRYHPDRNRLLRVMGAAWSEKSYEVYKPIKRETGKRQVFLMCSDGFWELIDEKSMQKLLKKADTPGQWLEAMEEIVCENGKEIQMDNYSAIAVFVD